MSDYELRRLELKSQMLSLDIGRIEQNSRELAFDLKKKERSNGTIEKSWLKFLKDTVSSYKSAPQRLQSQILSNNLKILSDSKRTLSKRKKEEQDLRTKLGNLLQASKQKQMHLAHCQGKKQAKQDIKAQSLEQNNTDEFASIKAAQRKHSGCSGLLVKKTSKKDAEQQKEISSQKIEKTLDIDEKIETKTLDTFSQDLCPPVYLYNSSSITRSSNSATDQSFSEFNSKQDNQFAESGHGQHKWEQAKESHDLISQQNEQVKVSILQTSQGDAICVDYFLSPGRMLSVGASKLADSSAVSLNISASNSSDKAILQSSQKDLLHELKNKGVIISNLEVAER